MADEMGIMVWSEIPVYWTILWDNSETFENARNQLGENVTRDKNSAAIILWSVANETPVGEARLKFLKGLIDYTRSLDSTRLLTAANERHYADPQHRWLMIRWESISTCSAATNTSAGTTGAGKGGWLALEGNAEQAAHHKRVWRRRYCLEITETRTRDGLRSIRRICTNTRSR